MGNYLDYIGGRESGNNYSVSNPNSSAGGKYQFVDNTWLSVVRRARPDLANLSDKQLIALKTSNNELGREVQEQAADYHLKSDVVPYLQKNGIEPDQKSIYLSWFAGTNGAVNILKSDPKTPISKILSKDAMEANASVKLGDKSFKDFTTGDIQEWAARNKSAPQAPAPRTATGTLSDEALTQGPPAPAENKPEMSTEDVLTAMEPRRQSSDMGAKELGFLHNYFKSMDTSATGVKPLAVPDLFHQQKSEYKDGGIVSLKKDAAKVRAAGIGGDTVLAHINPEEARFLKSMGGSGRINPHTGLPMFEDGDSEGGDKGDKGDKSEGPSTGENSTGLGGGVNPDVSGMGQMSGPGIGLNDSFGASMGAQGPGLGLNDSFGAQPGEIGPSMGAMSSNQSLEAALGNTSMGSFGLGGVTAGLSGPGVSSSFGGVAPTMDVSPTAPSPELATVNDVTSSFGKSPDRAVGFDLAAAIDKAVNTAVNTSPTFSSISPPDIAPASINPNSTISQAFGLSGPNTSTAPATGTIGGTATSTGLASTQSIGAMGLGALGNTATAAPSSSVSPSSSVAPSTNTTAPTSSTPTASSSTTKGPGYDITGISFLDSLLSNAINNPTATIAGLAVSAVNPVAGLANTALGNPIGMAADRAISSLTGTNVGYGNTVTSQEPGTTPASPSSPGPSVGSSFGDATQGDGSQTTTPISTSTASSSPTPVKPVSYDVSKFLGSLGQTSNPVAPSVYSPYPVQQGIGSIPAPQYSGNFYTPNFGTVPYQ